MYFGSPVVRHDAPYETAGRIGMRIRTTKEVIAKGRGAFVKRCLLLGTLFFGPVLGLCLINSKDMSNHSFWDKVLFLAACIIFAGPAWGFLSGHAWWYLIRRKVK